MNDVDGLVKDGYPHLHKMWADVKTATPGEAEERLSKIGQFMKLVVLHSEGGIYLDSDVIPCGGLDELIGGVRGPPAGVMSLPYGPLGADRAFAAPPGHPALALALKMMEASAGAAAGGMDGDDALRRAVTKALSVPASAPPKREGGWTVAGSVRVGSFPLNGPNHSEGSELDLWHLDLSAGGGREYLSRCARETEDIAPFLEEGCRATHGGRGKFEDCGRTVA